MRLLIKNVILKGRKVDILIENRKIKKIKKFLNERAKEKIDAKEKKAVLPGLINCHSHSPMILFRGIGEGLNLKDWLEKEIWPKERKLSPDDVYWAMKLASLEMIKTGTTTFNEMYWFEEAQIEAVKEMGLRAKIGLVLLDFLPMGQKEHILEILLKFPQFLKRNSRITFSLAPHAIYTVSKENLIWAKKVSKKYNLNLHLHLAETEKEVLDCQRKFKMEPVQFLEKIKFLDKNCILAHSLWLSDKEIEILKKRKCHLVYNPCSNMKLASGVFPYQKIKERKINLCLGTDGPASNDSLDLFQEMKMGALLQKITLRNPTIISAKEIFEIATKNGAKALRIPAGEIKEGKLADLILVDLNKLTLIPDHNLISNLVYSATGDCVSDVICDGEMIMRERKIEDEEKIKREFKKRIKSLR